MSQLERGRETAKQELTREFCNVFAASQVDPRTPGEAPIIRLRDLDLLPSHAVLEAQLFGHVRPAIAHVDLARVLEERAWPREKVEAADGCTLGATSRLRVLGQLRDEVVRLDVQDAHVGRVDKVGRARVGRPLPQLDVEAGPPFRRAGDLDLDLRAPGHGRREELAREVRGVDVLRVVDALVSDDGVGEDAEEVAAVPDRADTPVWRDVDVEDARRRGAENRRRRVRVAQVARPRCACDGEIEHESSQRFGERLKGVGGQEVTASLRPTSITGERKRPLPKTVSEMSTTTSCNTGYGLQKRVSCACAKSSAPGPGRRPGNARRG